MSAEENAETILIVIKRLFKWAIIGVLILLTLILVIIGYQYISQYYFVDMHTEKVKVEASINTNACPTGAPLLLTVNNQSEKTTKLIEVWVDVTKIGFSNRENDWSSYKIDKILKPSQTIEYCYQIVSNDYAKRFEGDNAFLKGDGLEAKVSRAQISFIDE